MRNEILEERLYVWDENALFELPHVWKQDE